MRSGVFRAGTSGLVLAEPNKQAYPEPFRDKSRLFYYSSQFNSIEINSSFYKVPMHATFEKWSAGVPAPFQFSVKLWRGITHAKGFAFIGSDIDAFMQAANGIGAKKGCLLIQLPPGATSRNAASLYSLLERVRRSDGEPAWKIAVEFRHPSWYSPETEALLNEHEASLVLHDMPASATMTLNTGARFVYMRFHGPAGDYKGGYSLSFLQDKAEQMIAWLKEGKDVYAYFNNTIGDAVANGKTLKKLIGD
jgi:uncharacterized protein YecE (DUF72 family)